MDGDDEVQPGEDGAEAGDEDRRGRGDDVGVEIVRGERRGEGPAGIDSAQHQRGQGQCAADYIEIPTEQIDLGEGEVARADHHGDQEIAQRCGNRRHQKQEDHDDAVHGEELVVGVRGDEVGLRREEFQPDEAGKRAADEEEKRDRDQIQDRDALVVAGEEPTEQAVLRVDEVAAWGAARCSGREG